MKTQIPPRGTATGNPYDNFQSSYQWNIILFLVTTFAVCCDTTCNTSISMQDLNADIIIGGLFPVHYFAPHAYKYTLNTYALTWIEAFHHSINLINKDPYLLPGIKLGFDIRDSCNDERYALRHVLDFMVDRSYFQKPKSRRSVVSTDSCTCAADARSSVKAVVGGASSSVSLAISHILGVNYVPQVSYSSTSVTLSDKKRYRSFLRTLPSDVHQAEAIAEFIQYFNWTFVNILASDDDYGRLGSDELREELVKRNICAATDATFPANITVDFARDLVRLLQLYQGKSNVNILWCEIGSAKTILNEAVNMGLLGMTWIGTESWGNNVDLFGLNKDIIHGIIGIKPMIYKVADFESHIKSLSHGHKQNNPWLKSYWNEVFKCGGANKSVSSKRFMYKIDGVDDGQMTIKCPDGSTAERSLPLNKYPNVMASVYSIAQGLHAFLECNMNKCTKTVDSIKGKTLVPLMRNLSFSLPNSTMKVSFDENGDAYFASYTFTNLVVHRDRGREHPSFKQIGSWDGESRRIQLFVDQIQWNNGSAVPNSRCSLPCKPGQFRIGGRQQCCWECAACHPDHISTTSTQTACTKCPLLTISNSNRTACLRLKTTTWSLPSLIGGIILAIIILSLLLILFIVAVLIKFRETPVVKSSNRELSLVQLCCCFLSVCTPLMYFFDTTVTSCIFRITWFSILQTIVVGVVFTKTYRLLLIFRKMTTEESKLLRNSYQALLVSGLVVVQVIVLGAWYLFYRPKVYYEIDRTTRTVVLHCGMQDDILFFLMSGLTFFLMLCSAYMAFKARKLPEGFNEARFISFAMYINSIIWLSYIPIHFSLPRQNHAYLYTVFDIVINLSILFLLYGKKVKIMLMHPELNTAAEYRRKAALSTIKAILKHKSGRPSYATGNPGKIDRSQTEDSICTVRLSPSMNRRYGVNDYGGSASSVIFGASMQAVAFT